VLIDLFDREFIESQEAPGMPLFGQFRDLDDPDRFVWLRGFADMPSLATALGAFYDGPVWQAHREAADAAMLDSDDVLLLRRGCGTRHARDERALAGGGRGTARSHQPYRNAATCADGTFAPAADAGRMT